MTKYASLPIKKPVFALVFSFKITTRECSSLKIVIRSSRACGFEKCFQQHLICVLCIMSSTSRFTRLIYCLDWSIKVMQIFSFRFSNFLGSRLPVPLLHALSWMEGLFHGPEFHTPSTTGWMMCLAASDRMFIYASDSNILPLSWQTINNEVWAMKSTQWVSINRGSIWHCEPGQPHSVHLIHLRVDSPGDIFCHGNP